MISSSSIHQYIKYSLKVSQDIGYLAAKTGTEQAQTKVEKKEQ